MYFNLPDNTPGWTYATNLGKLTLEQELGPSVQAVVAAPVRGADAAKAQSRSFIDQGCRIIIGIHITHRCMPKCFRVQTLFQGSVTPLQLRWFAVVS